MKYSSTDRPSRKFDLIGLSMISPMPPVSFFCGFAIKPRMPASCRIWSREPRLPESNIMNTGLNPPLDRCMVRSEEHTSELQSRLHLVCRLLLEKKKKKHYSML